MYNHEVVFELEKFYDVDSISLKDGTKIWNLVRVILASYNDNRKRIETENKLPKWYQAKLLLSSLKPINLKGMKYCAFSDIDSRRLVNGKYYDIYVDYLQDELDNFFVMEWPSLEGKSYKNIYSENYIRMKIPLSVIINKYRNRIKLSGDLCYILSEFCIVTDTDFIDLVDYIFESIKLFYNLKQYIKKLFRKNTPKMVFIRCLNGRFPMAVTQACRELHIPVTEIQHGVIWKDQVSYNKKVKSHNYDCIPDYIYTWNEKHAKILKAGNIYKKGNVIVKGFPFLENHNIEMKAELKEFISKYKTTILFTSQWAVSRILLPYVKAVPKDVGVIFKPHPRDLANYSFDMSNLYLMAKHDDTYGALRNVDINCSVYSTTIIEAEYYNTTNIIINSDRYVDMVDIDNKHNFLVNNVDEFIEAVNRIKLKIE